MKGRESLSCDLAGYQSNRIYNGRKQPSGRRFQVPAKYKSEMLIHQIRNAEVLFYFFSSSSSSFKPHSRAKLVLWL
jgi:hypothetical protein